MSSLVSIIMPCYNRAKFLCRALESVINQSYLNWEIIIVDDASTDNTSDVVAPYLKKYSRIRYIKLNINSGACVARNEGLKYAEGNYITFLDSDDEYLPKKIEKQVSLFQTSNISNLGVVSCGRRDVRNGKVYFQWIPKLRGNIFLNVLQKDRVGANTSFLMVKKEVLLKHSIQFDPSMPACQDWDFLIQLCRHVNFDFVPEVLVTIHHHSGERVYTNQRALLAFDMQFQKSKETLMKHPSIHQQFLLRMAIQNYLYGNTQKAIDILEKAMINQSFKINLWSKHFKMFPRFGTLPSRISYRLLKSIPF